MTRSIPIPFLALSLALAGCPARPKDEEGTEEGARESQSTGEETGKPEPKPSV